MDRAKVRLSDGTICLVEVNRASARKEVANRDEIFEFELVKKQIRKITEDWAETFKQLKPTKTVLEFGINLSIESGALTSVIVKGAGETNLKIILEWDNK